MYTPKQDLKLLLIKYWSAGMNNGYWHQIKDDVNKDIEAFCKKYDLKGGVNGS